MPRKTTRRSSSRRVTRAPARNYSRRSRSNGSRRTTARTTRRVSRARTSGAARTIRIEVVQTPAVAGPAVNPLTQNMVPAITQPKKAKF